GRPSHRHGAAPNQHAAGARPHWNCQRPKPPATSASLASPNRQPSPDATPNLKGNRMWELTMLPPPGRHPPAQPAAAAPHAEQVVVSCALLGYWTEPNADAAPSYRHRLGLHAQLVYHLQDTDTAS